MFVLGAILLMWMTTTLQINQSELVYTMDESATNAVEKLVRTEGLPRNWSKLNATNISAIGLVNESRVMDQGKMTRFMILMDDSIAASSATTFDNPCYDSSATTQLTNYECNRHFLGLGKYDFQLNVTYLDRTPIYATGKSPSDADYIISKKRTAIFDSDVVIITLLVWN